MFKFDQFSSFIMPNNDSKHMELAKEVARYLRTTCQEDSSEYRLEIPSPTGRAPEEKFHKGAF